jgi:hypothetical protein
MSIFKRVRKYLIPTLLIVILAVSAFAVYRSYSNGNQPEVNPNAYVGVAFCGNTTQEAKVLIDRVKSYTNLFVLDSGRNPISENQTSVEQICDYAVSQGLSVIINLGVKDHNQANNNWFWQQQSLESIKQLWTERWGSKFLGIYYNDEPGGIQLDANWTQFFVNYAQSLNQIDQPATAALYQIYLKMLAAMNNGSMPQNYDLEANFFVQDVIKGDPGLQALNSAGITTYTSDYGLYWYDYLGGYNVLFGELGWNCSVAEQIALVKGAARLQDKEWGAMITWTYDSVPYLDSGDQIYNQMLSSYQAGAKYIMIFNYPYVEGNNYGAMSDEQFIALQRFWNDITHERFTDLSAPEAALVLPNNYGWGMRNPNDTVWGFWSADEKSQQIGIATSRLLAQYGTTLDIVYDDPAYPVTKGGYEHVYYWNQTDIQ